MYRLRRSKAPEILLSLFRGPKHVRELQAEVRGSTLTVEMRIKELMREGLIEEEESKEWPFRRILKLTPKGMEVAIILKQEISVISKPARKGRKVREKEKWVLAVLRALDGSVEGSVRLQKLLFLLKRELGVDSLPLRFLPYLHGPYSEEVPDVVMELERMELVRVKREGMEVALCSLTPEGEKLGEGFLRSLPEEVRRKMGELRRFNEMRLKELLDYVYSRYPEESKYL